MRFFYTDALSNEEEQISCNSQFGWEHALGFCCICGTFYKLGLGNLERLNSLSPDNATEQAADIVLTKPGLSVVIDAIQESRRIFRRMENYAVYRIAATVRILIFLTLCYRYPQLLPVNCTHDRRNSDTERSPHHDDRL